MSPYFTVIDLILYSQSTVQYLGSLTQQHAQRTAEMGTHRGQVSPNTVSAPLENKAQLPCAPRPDAQVQMSSSGHQPGPA